MRIAGFDREEPMHLLERPRVLLAVGEDLRVIVSRGVIVRSEFEHALEQKFGIVENLEFHADSARADASPRYASGAAAEMWRIIVSAACVSPSANKLLAVMTAAGRCSRLAATFAAFSASALRPAERHSAARFFQLAGSAGFRSTARW